MTNQQISEQNARRARRLEENAWRDDTGVMKITIEQIQAGQCKLQEETLSDGSEVYNIILCDKVTIACVNETASYKLIELLNNTEFDILPLKS